MADRLALFDIDGVIADERHRTRHALEREWSTYFGLAHLDTVWPQGRRMYENAILAGFDVGYLTGRREDLRPVTKRWLKLNKFDHKLPLIMRKVEDRRPLAELKASVVRVAAEDLYAEVWMFDDDPAVIEHVAAVPGAVARHCRWHIKPERMVKRGRA